MDSWLKFCKGLFYFGAAAVLIAIAVYIVPAIGRSIDRQAPADEISCGAQYKKETGDFSLGFVARHAANVKDHPSAATEDGHDDK